MKMLYCIRHAKSSWEHPSLEDIERPLAPRGMKATSDVAQVLAAFKIFPELILTSPAQRAIQTATGLVASFPLSQQSIPIQKDSRIYESSWEMLLKVLQEVPDVLETVAIIGHNPSLEDLVENLCSINSDHFIRMPTAAVLYLSFEQFHWNQIQPGSALLQGLIPVRMTRRLLKQS